MEYLLENFKDKDLYLTKDYLSYKSEKFDGISREYLGHVYFNGRFCSYVVSEANAKEGWIIVRLIANMNKKKINGLEIIVNDFLRDGDGNVIYKKLYGDVMIFAINEKAEFIKKGVK